MYKKNKKKFNLYYKVYVDQISYVINLIGANINSIQRAENREEYNPNMLEENLMFGTPDEVIKKLKRYEDLGVDNFIYYASMGLDHGSQKRSLELFCEEVLPAFQ